MPDEREALGTRENWIPGSGDWARGLSGARVKEALPLGGGRAPTPDEDLGAGMGKGAAVGVVEGRDEGIGVVEVVVEGMVKDTGEGMDKRVEEGVDTGVCKGKGCVGEGAVGGVGEGMVDGMGLVVVGGVVEGVDTGAGKRCCCWEMRRP